MKFLWIYSVLFLFFWTNAWAGDRKDNLLETMIVREEARELYKDMHVLFSERQNGADAPRFDILKSFLKTLAADLLTGVDQGWNRLSYKVLYGIQKNTLPGRMPTWYASEWQKMLSVWHGKSFLLYFLKKLII